MRDMIAIAFGLLLLVSAASAGNNNIATVSLNEIMAGDIITGASLAQLSDIDANLVGNLDSSTQIMFQNATRNTLTGLGNGKTFLLQSGDMDICDTGNSNTDAQIELLGANANIVTEGNITQAAVQIDNDKGNNNSVVQFTASGIGVVLAVVGSPNILTRSELDQLSCLDASVTGNSNIVAQADLQGAFDNTMTDSRLWQQNSANAKVSGNGNVGPTIIIFPVMQGSIQIADGNTLTKSWANQLDCQNENIVGNTNTIGQFSLEAMTADIATNSGVLQKINEDICSLGNSNALSHNEELTSTANVVTGGNIIQQADAYTNS